MIESIQFNSFIDEENVEQRGGHRLLWNFPVLIITILMSVYYRKKYADEVITLISIRTTNHTQLWLLRRMWEGIPENWWSIVFEFGRNPVGNHRRNEGSPTAGPLPPLSPRHVTQPVGDLAPVPELLLVSGRMPYPPSDKVGRKGTRACTCSAVFSFVCQHGYRATVIAHWPINRYTKTTIVSPVVKLK